MSKTGSFLKKNTLEAALGISILTILGSLFALAALAALMADIRIPAVGNIGTVVTAQSGSVEDIQTAVDLAISKRIYNVTIPEGTFVFNVTDSFGVGFNVPAWGLSISGAGINRTVLDMPETGTTTKTIMFRINGESLGRIDISGITFKGRTGGQTGDEAILIESTRDFRIHHCSFHDMGGGGVGVYDCDVIYDRPRDLSKVSQGVIDHCNFVDIYKSSADPHIGVPESVGGYGYAVFVARSYHYAYTPWEDCWNLFGTYLRNVYIEDCYFTGARHAVTGNFAGAYVLRNSVIEDIMSAPWAECATTGHPVRELTFGMLSNEIYNVTIRKTGTKDLSGRGGAPGGQMYGPHWEGGAGLVYSNRIEGCLEAFQIGSAEDSNDALATQHQIPGWDNDQQFILQGRTKELYFWNNTVINCPTEYAMIDNSGGGLPPPTLGVDWFKQSPNSLGKIYQPYTYPHPLTLASMSAWASEYSVRHFSDVGISSISAILSLNQLRIADQALLKPSFVCNSVEPFVRQTCPKA